MKVRDLRAALEGFEQLFAECNRPSEVDMLRQLDALLRDYDSSKISALAARIRESRATSGRNCGLEVPKK
jgi:hypothetical protein